MEQTKVQVGGKEPWTAALKNVLAAQMSSPAYSEALLLGIGGGVGAGYILWEFKAHGSASIVLGFRNRWNYSVQFLTNLCERLGAPLVIQEAGGAKQAAANFQSALEREIPFIAWVDKAHMPHHQLPEALKGYGVHVVGVYGMEGDNVLVDDLGDTLYKVPMDIFTPARAQVPSDKNRLALVDAPKSVDLNAAVMAGIRDCVEHLGRDSESFSLPVLKKWAKLMTHPKDKKSWLNVFKERKGLYDTLRTVFEWITLDSTEGSGLRGMYADFLDEASAITGKAALKDAAQQYRTAAAKWVELAEAAMTDSVPVFKETKALMRQRYELTRKNEQNALRPVMQKLEAMQAEYNRNFPMKDAEVNALFVDLQDKLNAVYEAEVQALDVLRESVKG